MAGTPWIPGLALRHFAGEADLTRMAAIAEASRLADGIQLLSSVDDMKRIYVAGSGFDPHQDVVIAEVAGEMVAYARSWWLQEVGGTFLYRHLGFVAPAWRRKGIGAALLDWLERRQRSIALQHPVEAEKLFNVYVTQPESARAAMLAQAGYRPARYFFSMLRGDLEAIADFPLPAGIELRAVLPEHHRAVWETDQEVFASVWGRQRAVEGDYEAWLAGGDMFQPQLWQVGWDVAENRIAGQVRPYLDPARNRDAGMVESELEVDSDNPSGATRVYEACGFRITQRNVVYRKPVEARA